MGWIASGTLAILCLLCMADFPRGDLSHRRLHNVGPPGLTPEQRIEFQSRTREFGSCGEARAKVSMILESVETVALFNREFTADGGTGAHDPFHMREFHLTNLIRYREEWGAKLRDVDPIALKP